MSLSEYSRKLFRLIHASTALVSPGTTGPTMPVGRNFPLTVRVAEGTMGECKAFAGTMKETIQGYEWNLVRTGGRSVQEKYENILGGKIAECAVHNFLVSEGVKLGEPDFRIIGENARDDGDLRTQSGIEVSIKATAFGRYLAVHSGNLWWKVDDIYVLCRTPMSAGEFTGQVIILGWCTRDELLAQGFKAQDAVTKDSAGTKSLFYFNGKGKAPWGGDLQSDNLMIHENSLNHSIEELVKALQ